MARKFDPKAATKTLAKAITEAQPGEKILDLPVSRIEPDPEQPRKTFDPKYVESLAASIRTNGQESPIVVRPVSGNARIDYRIVYGERRWRACQAAGLKTVKAVVRELTDEDAAAIYSSQVAENFGQHSMTLAEQAAAALRMVELYGTAEATERMAIPKSDVTKLTAIGRAGGAVADALSAGHTESVETLYLLARVQKQDAAGATRIVSSWSDPEKRMGARVQVKHALDRLKSADSEQPSPPSRGPSSNAPKRPSAGAAIEAGFGRGGAMDEPVPVLSVEPSGDYLLLRTASAGTLSIFTEGLLVKLAEAGLIPSRKA